MAQPRRRPRATHPTFLLTIIAACGVLALSSWTGAYSWFSAPDARAVGPALDGMPELRPSFDEMWAAAGLMKDEGQKVTRLVNFEWAELPEAKGELLEAPTLLAFVEEKSFPAFDAVLNSDDPLAFAAVSPNEERCLANAIYFEARGEDRLGRLAVAQVVLNRVKDPHYPKTICGVVYQNADKFRRCQFSFACDGISDRIADKRSWAEAVKVARMALADDDRTLVAELDRAMFYHATSVSPSWASKMKRADTIGRHVFYERSRGKI